MQRVAPVKTGRLRRGITSRLVGGIIEIISTARNPDTGYAYTGVTRFGHRVRRIYPVKAKALAFTIGGRTLVRAWVRGYHPASDWAERGIPEALAVVERSAANIADELERRL